MCSAVPENKDYPRKLVNANWGNSLLVLGPIKSDIWAQNGNFVSLGLNLYSGFYCVL